ncbi:hypothetical protein D3C85_1169030 [compost metagenome]
MPNEIIELIHTEESSYQLGFLTCRLRSYARECVYSILFDEAESIGVRVSQYRHLQTFKIDCR